MINKHKFRVWDKAKKCWLPHSAHSLHAFTDYFLSFDGDIVATEGAISDHNEMKYADLTYINYKPGNIQTIEAKNRFVVLLCSDMKDKSGNEIFEGDKIYDNVSKSEGYINFKNGCFWVNLVDRVDQLYNFEQKDIKIIGNIFE